MTKTTRKSTTKRLPAKKRQSLAAKKVVARKKVIKKQPKPAAKAAAKKPAVSTSSKKTTAKKTPLRSSKKLQTPPTNQNQLLRLPLGRGRNIIISISRSPSVKNNQSSSSKKPTEQPQKLRTKPREFLVTLLIIFGGLLGMGYFGLNSVNSPTQTLAPASDSVAKIPFSSPQSHFLSYSQPVKLNIPSIQLDTALRSVGLQSDGTLEVPEQYKLAGWYRHGPTPGEKGPAVLVGHYDNAEGTTVFGRLAELTPGQIVQVNRQDTRTAQFVVEKIKQYPQNEFPVSEVYGDTNNATLRIITCGGTYNRLTQRYSHNTIVFASMIEPSPDDPGRNSTKVIELLKQSDDINKNNFLFKKSVAMNLSPSSNAL